MNFELRKIGAFGPEVGSGTAGAQAMYTGGSSTSWPLNVDPKLNLEEPRVGSSTPLGVVPKPKERKKQFDRRPSAYLILFGASD